jgi:hypothetical protein
MCRLWDNEEKYGTAKQATNDNKIRLMHFACRITKATRTFRKSAGLLLLFHHNTGFANMHKYYVTWTLSLLFSYVFTRHGKLFYARPSHQSSGRQYDLYYFMYILTLKQNSYVQHALHLTYTLFRGLKVIIVRGLLFYFKSSCKCLQYSDSLAIHSHHRDPGYVCVMHVVILQYKPIYHLRSSND